MIRSLHIDFFLFRSFTELHVNRNVCTAIVIINERHLSQYESLALYISGGDLLPSFSPLFIEI